MPRSQNVTMEDYVLVETEIEKSDTQSVLARHKSGVLANKDAFEHGGRLPHGRQDEILCCIKKSRTELINRMQFAEKYSTEKDALTAFQKYGSWTAICQEGLWGKKGIQKQEISEERAYNALYRFIESHYIDKLDEWEEILEDHLRKIRISVFGKPELEDIVG